MFSTCWLHINKYSTFILNRNKLLRMNSFNSNYSTDIIKIQQRINPKEPIKEKSHPPIPLGKLNKMIKADKKFKKNHQRQRPTHFLSIPIVSPTIKQAYTTLLNTPLFSSLDPQTLISQENLHITLGVLCLKSSKEMDHAIQLLNHQCLSLIQSYQSSSNPLSIDLHQLKTMQPHPKNAHVLYIQVKDNSHNNSFYQLCRDINQIMIDAGLMEKEHRPLKLHVTLINSIYGKKRSNEVTNEELIVITNNGNEQQQQPSSSEYQEQKPSSLASSEQQPSSSSFKSPSKHHHRNKRISFDATSILNTYGDIHFGNFTLDKLHLMKMGRTGPSNSYETISSIPF
ncbi:unnamed protein product [Cunninghamella blakesleeana]